MSKFKVINLLDKIFIVFCVFLLSYTWINFYLRNIKLTFFISCITTSAVCFLLFYFPNKKQLKVKQTNAQLEEIEKNYIAFKFLPLPEQCKIITQCFDLESEIFPQFFKKENDIFCLSANNEILSENTFLNLVAIAKNFGFDSLFIICKDCVSNLKLNLLKGRNIYIIDKTKLHEKFVSCGIKLDTTEINLDAEKFKFKDFAKSMFCPVKAKSYFICGLILLFSSIILPYNYYYIIFGSMLILFAIICKILPKIKN